MTIETILNSDMSVAYITDCATSPVRKKVEAHAEAEFLDVIGKNVIIVFLLAVHGHRYNGFTPTPIPSPSPPRAKVL